jgi:hypothetical protein
MTTTPPPVANPAEGDTAVTAGTAITKYSTPEKKKKKGKVNVRA